MTTKAFPIRIILPSAFQENLRVRLRGTSAWFASMTAQIETIIVSTRITSFSVERVQGGLEAVFTGSAIVKMNNEPWESGWSFTVSAFDLNGAGADMLGITLVDPQGQVQCSAEPTSLSSGNIIIKC